MNQRLLVCFCSVFAAKFLGATSLCADQ